MGMEVILAAASFEAVLEDESLAYFLGFLQGFHHLNR